MGLPSLPIWVALLGICQLGVAESPLITLQPGRSLASQDWRGEERERAFKILSTKEGTFLRSVYVPGRPAELLYTAVAWDLEKFPKLCWKWRVNEFPKNARVTDPSRSDAGAQLYVIHRSFPTSHVLKYYWAAWDPPGTEIRQQRFLGKLFGVVLRSGGVTGVWQEECRDVKADFLRGFGETPQAIQALGVLSDGDDTQTPAEADFAGWHLQPSLP